MNIALARARQLGFLLILLVTTVDFLILWDSLFLSKKVTSEFFNTAYDELLDFSVAESSKYINFRSVFVAVMILSDPSMMISEIHSSWGKNFEATSLTGEMAYFVDSPSIDESLQLFPVVQVRPPIFPLATTRLCRMELEATKYFLSSTAAGWMLVVHERTWVNYSSVLSIINTRVNPNQTATFYAGMEVIKSRILPHSKGGWVISREFARKHLENGENWMKTCTGETTRAVQLMDLSQNIKGIPRWTDSFIGIHFSDYEMESLLTMNMSRIDACKYPLAENKIMNDNEHVKKLDNVAVWNIPNRKYFLKISNVIPDIKNIGYSFIDGEPTICSYQRK